MYTPPLYPPHTHLFHAIASGWQNDSNLLQIQPEGVDRRYRLYCTTENLFFLHIHKETWGEKKQKQRYSWVKNNVCIFWEVGDNDCKAGSPSVFVTSHWVFTASVMWLDSLPFTCQQWIWPSAEAERFCLFIFYSQKAMVGVLKKETKEKTI